MGFLSFLRDERVVLAGIGLATFSLVSLMTVVLTIIRDDNEIKIQQPKTQYITQETEDSLHLDTLDKLIGHPNYAIREVAIRILCDRAVNDGDVLQELLYGITVADYDHRMKCLRALATLTGQTLDGLSKLHTPKAYSALVRSLEMSLADNPERPQLNDDHWDEYFLRDMAEKFCLLFINELINKHGVGQLLRAKFVSKWLAKQNWGTEESERQKNFHNYMNNVNKQNRIVDIVHKVQKSRSGWKALKKAKLVPKDQPAADSTGLGVYLEITMGTEDGETAVQLTELTGTRARDQTAEEQRLRRQHREAMVFNDGTRPIGREDIIERGHDSPS